MNRLPLHLTLALAVCADMWLTLAALAVVRLS